MVRQDDSDETFPQRATVVVADDEVHVVALIAQLLEGRGVEVVKAYNGQDALEAVVEHRPRVLITDVVMPRLRGDELVRKIKAQPETAQVRVIFVTSQPPDEVADSLADAYIAKPFDLSQVESVVMAQLESTP